VTPELTAAVARMEKMADDYEKVGGMGAAVAALRLVLAAVTPREGAEGLVAAVPDVARAYVSDVQGDAYATVYGSTEAEALATPEAVVERRKAAAAELSKLRAVAVAAGAYRNGDPMYRQSHPVRCMARCSCGLTALDAALRDAGIGGGA